MARNQPETQLIFRAPPEMAAHLHQLLEKKEGEDFFELKPVFVPNRQGEQVAQFKLKLGEKEHKASVIDLPCVIEAHKTLDEVNLFKAGHISQMVYVHPEGIQFLEDMPDFDIIATKIVEVSEKGARSVRYLGRDGITPPTRDIRNRYFRKEFPVPPERVAAVEKEMVSILKECRDKKKPGESAK